jgi:alcohol dehydrogenase class IV
MFKQFRFRIPDWILFGFDTANEVGAEAKRLGAGRVMVLTDPGVANAGVLERVVEPLRQEDLYYEVFDRVEPEPSIENLMEAFRMAKAGKFDVLVAVGGGSTMDTTKVVSAMMINEGSIEDFFGLDRVPHRGLPTILITTTSGTGSEVTKYAVFTDIKVNCKRVVISQNILPNMSIVDPNMAKSMPRAVTASTGFDAFIHAVEAYLSVKANPFTDTFALEAIKLIAGNLGPAFANGSDMIARYNMALASLTAGIALNNVGGGAVHALGVPIGAEYHLPHGTSLAVVFIETMRAVAVSSLPRFRKIGEAMGLNVNGLSSWDAAKVAIDEMMTLAHSVKLPTSISKLGKEGDRAKIKEWAEAAYGQRGMLGNTPRDLTLEDVVEIFEKSF